MHLSALVTLSCVFSLGASQIITVQNLCLPAGGYTLCQNLWGEAAGVGSQNSTLTSSSTQSVSWATSYTWANNPNNVKSFVEYRISADVLELELCNPIFRSSSRCRGPDTNWEVFSFVSAGRTLNSFNVDLNAFFTYLISEQGVAATQYLQVIQAGTEAVLGSANVVTSSYSFGDTVQLDRGVVLRGSFQFRRLLFAILVRSFQFCRLLFAIFLDGGVIFRSSLELSSCVLFRCPFVLRGALQFGCLLLGILVCTLQLLNFGILERSLQLCRLLLGILVRSLQLLNFGILERQFRRLLFAILVRSLQLIDFGILERPL
ncbi:concanavalin A-like lectin/glucanase domain-containing protein [Mycena galericulata]|nr:concanavalin A-like lectin/glucanase domain-containing protein [Mycena galericulata]